MNDKKLLETVRAIESSKGTFTRLTEYVSIKPFGDTQHVLLSCGFPGFEGEVLLHATSLQSLGAVLKTMGDARTPLE